MLKVLIQRYRFTFKLGIQLEIFLSYIENFLWTFKSFSLALQDFLCFIRYLVTSTNSGANFLVQRKFSIVIELILYLEKHKIVSRIGNATFNIKKASLPRAVVPIILTWIVCFIFFPSNGGTTGRQERDQLGVCFSVSFS